MDGAVTSLSGLFAFGMDSSQYRNSAVEEADAADGCGARWIKSCESVSFAFAIVNFTEYEWPCRNTENVIGIQ